MQIKSLISEIKSELNKLPIENIPNVVFFSFKSVNDRMKPIQDRNVDDLSEEAKNELHALLETIQNLHADQDIEKSCKSIDSVYQYQLIPNGQEG